MSIEPNDPLEQSLRELTWWPDAAPGLWKQALRVSERKVGAQGAGWFTRVLRSPWPWLGAPVAAVIVVAVFISTEGRMDRAAMRSAGPPAPVSEVRRESSGEKWRRVLISNGATPSSFICPSSDDSTSAEDNPQDYDTSMGYFVRLPDGTRAPIQPKDFICPSGSSALEHRTATSAASDAPDRYVIRKVAIDVQAEDVRGVYLKVQTMLPNEAIGEFIEQSQIHETGGQLSAYVVLRVRPERLSATLDALRGLGNVLREQSDASDVTAQVVDIEARLRNERRVEQELLGLLDKRKDAPLEDVLKLSNSLAEVRGRIESLTADQQRIAHQVALASIVVTIQAKPKTETPPPASTGFRIGERLGAAGADGLSFLIDSVAAIMRVILGGLVWWVILIVTLVVLRRWYMRRTAA